MSMTLRAAAATLLGFPPVFRRVKRLDPAPRVDPVVEPPLLRLDPRGVDMGRLLEATRSSAPELSIIEWDGDADTAPAVQERVEEAPAADVEDMPMVGDARCRRIRDRYIGARFGGVARSAADLENPDRVVKAARLYFEDGQPDTALELLDIAIGHDSRAEALWLAQLEILFLVRDAQRYSETARAFRALHSASASWDEVARLGRALAPHDMLFATQAARRDHDHYGPWPDLPNWIQANWDLTAEVLAGDFHRILKQRAKQPRAA
jgi:hypothetical protein